MASREQDKSHTVKHREAGSYPDSDPEIAYDYGSKSYNMNYEGTGGVKRSAPVIGQDSPDAYKTYMKSGPGKNYLARKNRDRTVR